MRQSGFTLVEVMVALAVVAIALPALLVALYQQVDSTAYLRDKSMAHAIAANKLTELRLLSRARQGLFRGNDGGVVEMGDREWYWWLQTRPTEVEQFHRVEISVALEETSRDIPLYTLVAFMSADLQAESEDVTQ
jgi:general secretion pathway protein I